MANKRELGKSRLVIGSYYPALFTGTLKQNSAVSPQDIHVNPAVPQYLCYFTVCAMALQEGREWLTDIHTYTLTTLCPSPVPSASVSPLLCLLKFSQCTYSETTKPCNQRTLRHSPSTPKRHVCIICHWNMAFGKHNNVLQRAVFPFTHRHTHMYSAATPAESVCPLLPKFCLWFWLLIRSKREVNLSTILSARCLQFTIAIRA